jgi:hypothetical protein
MPSARRRQESAEEMDHAEMAMMAAGTVAGDESE